MFTGWGRGGRRRRLRGRCWRRRIGLAEFGDLHQCLAGAGKQAEKIAFFGLCSGGEFVPGTTAGPEFGSRCGGIIDVFGRLDAVFPFDVPDAMKNIEERVPGIEQFHRGVQFTKAAFGVGGNRGDQAGACRGRDIVENAPPQSFTDQERAVDAEGRQANGRRR